VIACDGLVRIYKQAELEVVALQGLDLLVEGGEMVAIVGASGSGKSTLLGILGGMDVPSAGRAVVSGYDLGRLGNAERTRFRRRVIGFVWQQTGRNLLPYLTAVENVELPMVLDGRKARRARALELLALVELRDRAQPPSRPAQRRRAATDGDRGRARQRRASSSPTSRRASWTARPPATCSACSGG
jgi:ABC-type lipoprotein export system ATPase subunit